MAWLNYQGFKYKVQKYHNSCVPCSLMIILRNLGYDSNLKDLEDAWGCTLSRLDSKGRVVENKVPNKTWLDANDPTNEQILWAMQDTWDFNENVKTIIPDDINQMPDNEIKTNTLDMIRNVLTGNRPSGMMIGDMHANEYR